MLALLVAAAEVGNWGIFLRFLYQVPYGADDPLYSKDIGFYLFSLPAYILIKNWMMLTLVLSALFAGTIYWVHGDIEYDVQHRSMSPAVIAHGSAVLGLLFAVKAWSYGLDRYLLLYGDNGVVVGASYTDVYVGLPGLWLLIGFSIIAAFATWAKLLGAHLLASRRRVHTRRHRLFRAVRCSPCAVPAVFRQTKRAATGEAVHRTQHRAHPASIQSRSDRSQAVSAEQKLTFKALDANRATIDNIRLWDWLPLSDTYAQLQEIRTYYKFHDLDVDRYWLDGSYQSVMISARELRPSLLPPNAQTWVNRHVLFTHGNGAVMSPVTRKSVEGLPFFYLRDIPPVADGGPKIREPRIYYSEESDSYIIVKGSTPEFDYPKGKDNVYAAYDGTGGVPIGAMAARCCSPTTSTTRTCFSQATSLPTAGS